MKMIPVGKIGLALACCLAMSLQAQNVFLLNGNGVDEYDSSGNPVHIGLISDTSGSAIALSGNDIFVANTSQTIGGGTVAEYTTSGSTVFASLITGLSTDPSALAVSGGDIFVANYNLGTIGEYNMSGTPVNPSLITGLDHPLAIAISGTNIYVENGNGLGNSVTVGEYTTSGGTVSASLISGIGVPVQNPGGIAVSGSDLFVANTDANAIGEYTLSGTPVNTSFITGGFGSPTDMTIYGTNIYVNVQSTFINEYSTSGSTVAHPLIGLDPSIPANLGIAVGPVPEPSTAALLLAGLGSAAFWLRRGRKS